MRPNPLLFPPRGFRFTDQDGEEFVSTSWLLLAEAVRDYRQANDIPVGDPLTEIHEQACARNPSLCSLVAGKAPVMAPGVKLARDVAAWLQETRRADAKGALSWISEEEAARRAGVCRRCPANQKPTAGCKSCASASEAALRELRRAGPRLNPDGLGGCKTFGFHVETACRTAVSPADGSATPPNGCWRAALT